jgi:hypothetical protein
MILKLPFKERTIQILKSKISKNEGYTLKPFFVHSETISLNLRNYNNYTGHLLQVLDLMFVHNKELPNFTILLVTSNYMYRRRNNTFRENDPYYWISAYVHFYLSKYYPELIYI